MFSSDVESYINNLIKEIREIQNKNYDQTMERICSHFIYNDSNIDNICKNEQGFNFSFKKKPIVNKILIAQKGEDLKIKFETLVDNIRNSINLNKDVENLRIILENINYNLCYDLNYNYVKTTTSWNSSSLKSNKTEVKILSNEENNKKYLDSEHPVKLKIHSVNLPITTTKNIYLYGHYNTADLSMLENWNTIKIKNIDILKKSYLSIKSPIKMLNEKIYIKDTVLLASAAAGSLDAVGKAHGLTKIDIPKYFIQGRMDELLNTNFNLFKSYAMKDSLITLIHALFMNDFSFNLGNNTNPSTLGSLSSKYLLKK
jgi:hypothetical protein